MTLRISNNRKKDSAGTGGRGGMRCLQNGITGCRMKIGN